MRGNENDIFETLSESIKAGSKTTLDNTWGKRWSGIVPVKDDENSNGKKFRLVYQDLYYDINHMDEAAMITIAKCKFLPLWLLKESCNQLLIPGIDMDIDHRVDIWFKIGLVTLERHPTGIYLRPTNFLFDLFKIPREPYTDIPFNMLTHDISCQRLMLDVMMGQGIGKIILENEFTIPRYSEGLQLDEYERGTNIIIESEFRNPRFYQESYIKELNDAENKINIGIRNGEYITKELEDHRFFVIVKKISNTGVVKRDYKFHIPDLIIPNPRDAGKSRSIAIEMELSNKRAEAYKETFERYRDNNKFSVVYWFCATNSIKDALREAYESVGGCGSCRVKLCEFPIPRPSFNF